MMCPYYSTYAKVAKDVSLLHSLPGKQFLLSNIDTVLYRRMCGRCDKARGCTWLHVAVSNTGPRLWQEIPVVCGLRPASGIDIYCFH